MSTISVDYDVLNQRGSPAWFSDTFANIPTAGFKGRMFISTDTFAFYRDTGTGWDLIGGPGIGTLTGSGVAGQVSFFSGTQVLAGNNNLFWDNVNSRLGINTTTPGQPLDIHSTGNTLVQLNNTTTANSNISFQNQNVAKWRVGNVYNAGANSFDILNATTSTTALSISNTTNAATFNNSVTASSLIKSGGTSSQFLKADGSIDSNSYITLTSLSFVAGSGAYSNTTGVITIPTNNNQITNGAGYITSSALSSYLPLTGGTLTGQLYINPTNAAITGLDVASNTTSFRSDNVEGFKRQLLISMSSGTLIQFTAKGFGADYGTDLAFYTATTGGVNASPGIYITGTNNRVGIKTGTPAYDLDVSGTFRVSGAGIFSAFLGVNGSPATAFPLEAYINSSTAYTTSSRGNILRVFNSNTTANIYAGIELGGAGTSNDGLAGLNAVVTASGSAALTFYTRDSNTFAERMRITSDGKIGISISSPAFLLDVGGGVNGVTQNVCRIGNTAGYTNGLTVSKDVSNIYTFNFGDNSILQSSYTYGNTVTSPRTVYVNSSGVLGGISSILASKTNIKEFDTNWLYDLKPIQFNYRKKDENEEYTNEFDTELYYGLIAEETELINKEICIYNDEKLIGIEYSKLIPVLLKAIQELNEKLVKNNIN